VRILIVDDNPDVAQILGLLLQRCGHAVDVVSSGAQCLSRLQSFNADVLLLDLSMPDISGYELARQIRSRPEYVSLAIVALSAYDDPERIELSLAAGCDDHHAKPADPTSLGVAMARAVGCRRQLAASMDTAGK
jgi:CheY-like chemotaxis protein